MHNVVKMVKHTLKILRCKRRKIFKYVWPFLNIVHERADQYVLGNNHLDQWQISQNSNNASTEYYAYSIAKITRSHFESSRKDLKSI